MQETMIKSLKFSHKILLAAALALLVVPGALICLAGVAVIMYAPRGA